jgi:ABC-type molybdate transport system substrate-binding protein
VKLTLGSRGLLAWSNRENTRFRRSRAVKLGTSTPLADPSGDYAWEVFRKADALRPGAFSKLEQKSWH